MLSQKLHRCQPRPCTVVHGLSHLLETADAIAGSKKAGNIGGAMVVHLDKASVQLGTQLAGHVGAVGSAQRYE